MRATYRDATAADANTLRELFAESFVETFGHLYRPTDLEEFLDDNSLASWNAGLADPQVAIRLAEAQGELLGFVELAPQRLPYETPARTIELRRLYVRSSAHGRGIAQELMRWALAEAATRSAEEVVLSVYIDNHRARRFYDRFGFDAVGTYGFKVGSHLDEDLILRRTIVKAPA